MTGTVAAGARADRGSGSMARPDRTMAAELREYTSRQRAVQKRVAARKRRQRDRAIIDEQEPTAMPHGNPIATILSPYAVVIPDDPSQPIKELDHNPEYAELRELLDCRTVEAVPVPALNVRPGRITETDSNASTAYIDEDGKIAVQDGDAEANMRATDFMVPGAGLFWGDYIAGTFILVGFDPSTGEHRRLPAGVVARARLIADEAGLREPSPREPAA